MKTKIKLLTLALGLLCALALPPALRAQGLLDTTFANPNLNGLAFALAVDGSGKILVSGDFTTAGSGNSSYGRLARFNADGTLDTTFANPNLNDRATALAVDGSGKILVAGWFTTAGSGNSSYGGLARFNADGTLDTTFADPNLNSIATALAVDGSGKILVAGFFGVAGSGNSSYHRLARFNADGTLDTTFANPNLGGVFSVAWALAVAGSGKILVSGDFTTAGSGNSSYGRLARFNADGTLDTSFANPNLNGRADALAVDGSGKILVGGFFTTAGSGNSSYGGLARFNADGTLDTTFANPNLDSRVNALAVDGSGKILVGGQFSTAGSGNSSYGGLARFNADGTLDTTFANPNLSLFANALAVDRSGKILVGGDFTTAGSGNSSYNFLARFTGSVPVVITTTSIGSTLTLFWPDTATGYRVESTLSFTPSVIWNNVTGTFQTNGGSISIALPMTGTQKFYRLIKP